MNVEGNSISELTTTFWQMAFDILGPVIALENEERLASTTAGTP